MASEQDDAVFDQDLDDDDDDSQSQEDDDLENDDVLGENDEEEEDEEDLNSPSTSSPITATTTVATVTAAVPVAVAAASAVTVAVPNGEPPTATPIVDESSDLKRQRIGETLVIQEEKKPPAQFDESRRLFQRLWTDEDEIELLQGFLDYTSQRGAAHHHDTALFYDQIKCKLQLDFNKNQLVEKLRRLKKKYRNVVNKISSGKEFSFKSPHDQATFEISRKIWSNTGRIGVEDNTLDDEDANLNHNMNDNEMKIEDGVGNSAEKKAPRSRKRSRSRSSVGGAKIDEKRMLNDGLASNNDNTTTTNNNNNGGNLSSLIEETVRSCLSPLFKELLSSAMMGGPCVGGAGRGIGGLAMNAVMPLSFGGGAEMVDERWRKQQILELEVYSRRLELVQDQIKTTLDELRSMGV